MRMIVLGVFLVFATSTIAANSDQLSLKDSVAKTVLLKKSFSVPIHSEFICFSKGTPVDCNRRLHIGETGYCKVEVKTAERFERVIDIGLPKRLNIGLYDWTREYSEIGVYFVSVWVEGKNIKELYCSNKTRWPTVADFKTHFGDYIEWESVTQPIRIEP